MEYPLRIQKRPSSYSLRSKIRWLFFATGTCFGIWFSGLLWFASTLPEAVTDFETPTDLIVVLTGGSERIETGLMLLEEGKSSKLFVSGVHPNTTLEDLFGKDPSRLEALRDRIILGHEAANTIGNATETAQWVKNHSLQSIRLVTAAYHMPRSLLEFKAILSPSVKIIPHPVFPGIVQQKEWWRFPGTLRLIVREYNKYIISSARIFLFKYKKYI